MINKENIKKLIEKYGTLNNAANLIGISPATLSRLLNNKRAPGNKTIHIFARFCKKNDLDLNDYINFVWTF